MNDDTRRAMLLGLLNASVLFLLHHLLYPYRKYMEGYRKWVAYVIGVSTLLVTFSAWAKTKQQKEAARAFALITFVSGAGDIIAWLLREQREAD